MFHFIIIMMMCFFYIIQALIKNDVVDMLYIVLCLTAFILAFSRLATKNKWFTGILFLAGVFIHYIYGNEWLHLVDGITQNLALLSIILLAPMISLPLEGEGLIKTVVAKLDEWKENQRKSFFGVSSFMMMLAPILNMGAIRVVHGFVGKTPMESKLLSHAYIGGFTPAVVWSPFFASVGVVITMANIPYVTYMPIGILFSLIMVLAAIILFRPEKSEIAATREEPILESKQENSRDYVLLISFVLFLVLLLIGLEYLTKLPMLLLVSINCILIPFVWTLVRNKWGWMKVEMSRYKEQLISRSNIEISLFLSAGLFGNALMHTPITSSLGGAIIWASQWSVLLVTLLVVSFITMLALLGIHQIIAIPIIFPLLLVPEVDVTLFAAAFMCIFSWMFSSTLSPLNALNIIISSCVQTNGVRVGVIWNGKYFLAVFIAALGYVLLLNQL
ncbi:hypothetical protein [Oceanobacillus luteolus]|uniref:C4-dicarboxylate ABC transporter n=1 Tax=Oceanobacillus luteolus TaxID=1274358 RepID=A0ABW4HN91_9BACI